MTRNLRARDWKTAAAFAAVVAALGVGSVVLDKKSTAHAAAGKMAPRFEVDPMWPKPLPNHWVLGNVIGVAVDAQDHIWIIHRQGSLEAMENYAIANPPAPGGKRQKGVIEAECCQPAPAVLEFDEQGNLLASWGGQDGEGYVWPLSNHGITVDYKGNVWIGGNAAMAGVPAEEGLPPAGRAGSGRGAAAGGRAAAPGGPPLYHDSMVLKFTQSGKFLMQIGKSGQSKGSNDTENLGRPAKMFVDPKTNE